MRGRVGEDKYRARFFFSSHQDDYSVLRNERALPKIFNFKEKFLVKAHPLLLSLVGRKAFNII